MGKLLFFNNFKMPRVYESSPWHCRTLTLTIKLGDPVLAKQAIEIGIPAEHIEHLRRMAKVHGVLGVFRARTYEAAKYVGMPGYEPKPPWIKLKCAKTGQNAGLVVIPSGKPTNWEPWEMAEVKKLLEHGYHFDQNGVLVSAGLKRFYSDVDIQGVYRKLGKHYSIVEFNDLKLANIKKDLLPPPIANIVTHAPNDNYDTWDPVLRKRKMLRQPDPYEKYLVIYPDGTSQLVESTFHLRKIYDQLQIPWPYDALILK